MRDGEDPEIEHIQERTTKVGITDPEKDRRDLKATTLIVVVFLAIIIPLTLISISYLMVVGLAPSPCCMNPTGQFGDIETTSNTTATVEFAGFSMTPNPEQLTIVVETQLSLGLFGIPLMDSFYITYEGRYYFPHNDDNVRLQFEGGLNLADIGYKDYADNELVNSGDQLRLSGLFPGVTYTVKMLWEDGTELDSISFEMPDG